jgi:hypothetical protein
MFYSLQYNSVIKVLYDTTSMDGSTKKGRSSVLITVPSLSIKVRSQLQAFCAGSVYIQLSYFRPLRLRDIIP